MTAFSFELGSSAIWIAAGVVGPGAPVITDRVVDSGSVYPEGSPLGALLVCSHGRTGRCHVRWLWSGDIIGWAGGGGYDKRGAALAEALAYLYGMPLVDGGRGVPSVIEQAERHGVTVSPASDLAWKMARGLGVSA